MANKVKLGVIFGGKSGEHEVSCVSASYVLNAIDKSKYTVKTIGITKKGEWLLYEGPAEAIADGSWEKKAEADLKANPEHFSFQILGAGGRSLKNIIDFALPILHGPNGEDGTVQGLFELINIPYGGCGVVGCAATMDKIIAKEIFASAGLKQTLYVAFTKSRISSCIGSGSDSGTNPGSDFCIDSGIKEENEENNINIEERINKELKYPVFVKPANMGSSVGITRVADKNDLHDAILFAAKYDERLVVEQGVNCRELECAVIGNEELFTGAVGEIIAAAQFYDYDAKYNNPASRTLIPAAISKEEEHQIIEMAKTAYKAAGCCGFSRVDFMMDKDTHEIYINEINAIPGFTSISMFPKLCMAKGMTYSEIIERIIDLGYERYNAKNNR